MPARPVSPEEDVSAIFGEDKPATFENSIQFKAAEERPAVAVAPREALLHAASSQEPAVLPPRF